MEPIVLLALLLSTPQTTEGPQATKAIATCAALDIETARLDCFERLTRAVALIPFTPEPPVSKAEESARDVRTISPPSPPTTSARRSQSRLSSPTCGTPPAATPRF